MRSFLFLAFAVAFFNASAQDSHTRCGIISVQLYMGNKVESVNHPTKHFNDGSFSLLFRTGSDPDSTDLYNECSADMGYTHYHYAADGELLSTTCAPRGSDDVSQQFQYYVLANGDTLFLGAAPVVDHGNDVAIERRDAGGNILLHKTYGGSGSEGAAYTVMSSDSFYYIGCSVSSDDGDVGFHYGEASPFSPDIWLLKVNSWGDTLWKRVLGGTGQDQVSHLLADAAGGVYVFGTTTSTDHDAVGNHGFYDMLVLHLDSAGTTLWSRCYGGSDGDGSSYARFVKAAPDGSGGFYVMGETKSHDGDVQRRLPMGQDLWLIHIDSVGELLWENTFGGPGEEYPADICRGSDGSIWMGAKIDNNPWEAGPRGGHVDSTYGRPDGWVVHIDTAGNFINQLVIGANGHDEVIELEPLSDGSVFVAGIFYPRQDGVNLPRTEGLPQQSWGPLSENELFVYRLDPANALGIGDPHPLSPLVWQLYPNPATGKGFEVIIEDAGDYLLQLYDGRGALLHQVKLQAGKHSIKTGQGLTAGSYTVVLSDVTGNRDSKKMIVK